MSAPSSGVPPSSVPPVKKQTTIQQPRSVSNKGFVAYKKPFLLLFLGTVLFFSIQLYLNKKYTNREQHENEKRLQEKVDLPVKKIKPSPTPAAAAANSIRTKNTSAVDPTKQLSKEQERRKNIESNRSRTNTTNAIDVAPPKQPSKEPERTKSIESENNPTPQTATVVHHPPPKGNNNNHPPETTASNHWTTTTTTSTSTSTTPNQVSDYTEFFDIPEFVDDKTKEETTDSDDDDTEPQPRPPPKKGGPRPLNIILLYADDWRHDTIGSAGTQPIRTPFLDRLATEGVRFTHNCVTTSICWISRATLLTGQYLSKHKSDRPKNPKFKDYWNYTFPYLLKHTGGYDVGHIGKWNFWGIDTKIRGPYKSFDVYEGRHYYPGNPHPIHTTERDEQLALEFLQTKRNKHKNFMLTVAFFAPHAMDNEPEQYFPQNISLQTLYNDITLRPSIDMDASFRRMPYFFTERNEGRRRWRYRFNTTEKYDRMLKNYYRLCSEIDKTSERIYNELKRQGILNETLIIFTTDNGLFHGEHGLAGKWYPYEESIRTPLIIRDPRMPPSKIGTTDDSFTLNIDLYSTILGAANIDIPPDHNHDGRDISDLYLDKNGGKPLWRKEFYYEHPWLVHNDTIQESTALVRKDYKYFRWPNDNNYEQLFHLLTDPQEENDLARSNNSIHIQILNEMRVAHDELKKIVKL